MIIDVTEEDMKSTRKRLDRLNTSSKVRLGIRKGKPFVAMSEGKFGALPPVPLSMAEYR